MSWWPFRRPPTLKSYRVLRLNIQEDITPAEVGLMLEWVSSLGREMELSAKDYWSLVNPRTRRHFMMVESNYEVRGGVRQHLGTFPCFVMEDIPHETLVYSMVPGYMLSEAERAARDRS